MKRLQNLIPAGGSVTNQHRNRTSCWNSQPKQFERPSIEIVAVDKFPSSTESRANTIYFDRAFAMAAFSALGSAGHCEDGNPVLGKVPADSAVQMKTRIFVRGSLEVTDPLRCARWGGFHPRAPKRTTGHLSNSWIAKSR